MQEIGTLRQYVETNTTTLRGREVVSEFPGAGSQGALLSDLQEIEMLRKELEETKATLAGCEEVRNHTDYDSPYY